MALAASEQQKAAQLSWDRRQAATINQKKGGRSLDFSAGLVDGETKSGGGLFTRRNMLALAQSQDRAKFLKDRLVEEAKVQAMGAAGALAGSVLPGVGSAVVRKGVIVAARSPLGKWMWWGMLAAAAASILLVVIISVAVLQYACSSTTVKYFVLDSATRSACAAFK